MNERLVRKEVGAKHDAERDRKGEVICGLLYEEALQGRIYTMTHFAETFENTGGLPPTARRQAGRVCQRLA